MPEFAVFVDSRGGNTRKVADAIAEELGIAVGDIRGTLPADARILFLGSGTYGGKPGDAMTAFVGAGTFSGRKVALFGTSASAAGSERMLAALAGALKEKGAIVAGSWHCPGRFLLVNRGRPGPEDLEHARTFAREMAAPG